MPARTLVFLSILALSALGYWIGFTGQAVKPSEGARLYAENCASCHGANLEGQPDWRTPDEDGVLPAPPHDETGHTWHHDDQLLFNYTKFGGQITMERLGVNNIKSGMPSFEDSLSDDQIERVLSFIKSTWPARIQEIQRQRSRPKD